MRNRKLISERNRNWLLSIDAYQKTLQARFVLAGVGHLVGPAGIIEALKKKGYRINKLEEKTDGVMLTDI